MFMICETFYEMNGISHYSDPGRGGVIIIFKPKSDLTTVMTGTWKHFEKTENLEASLKITYSGN